MQQGAEGVQRAGSVKPLATRVTHGLSLMAERLLPWATNPYTPARLLGIMGATIAQDVWVYEARFMNPDSGFKNLTCSRRAQALRPEPIPWLKPR